MTVSLQILGYLVMFFFSLKLHATKVYFWVWLWQILSLNWFWIFSRFGELHEFEKPNDEKALNLMNACATAVLEEYPDIVFSYGFGDEYRSSSYLQLLYTLLLFFCTHHKAWYLKFSQLLLSCIFSFVFKMETKFYQRRARYLF